MAVQEIRLPELGENIHTAEVVKVLASIGDSLQKNQPILELETEKSVFEIPSSQNGTVKSIRVKAGDKIKVGDILMTLEVENASLDSSLNKEKISEQPTSIDDSKPKNKKHPSLYASKIQGTEKASTSPSTRKIVRELGIDLSQIRGSGINGRILTEDVVRASQNQTLKNTTERTTSDSALPDFSKWGKIEKKPMGNVRLKTAEQVSKSWNLIPHVTQFDQADITLLEEIRKKKSKETETAGGKLTITAILLKKIVLALKQFPQLNASIDLSKEEIIYKNYYHIGIAVDTERGLLAPVIQNVDQKDILEISIELKKISEKARSKKLTPEEMQGGSFTLTNLGSIGGNSFTPIIRWPEVAILGVSRSETKAVWINEKWEPRILLPLSLSYDHRLVDGADGARFLRSIVQSLEENPSL